MLFLRRSPTLEVHVPVSPTRTFLNMAHYLTRSLRVRGGRYRDAPIILTVGAEKRDPGLLARNHPWMADNGVEVRWIDEALFARESWYATACERFPYGTRAWRLRRRLLALTERLRARSAAFAGRRDHAPASEDRAR